MLVARLVQFLLYVEEAECDLCGAANDVDGVGMNKLDYVVDPRSSEGALRQPDLLLVCFDGR